MFNPNTPFYMIYTSMTCPCSQCQQERNAPTAILPRIEKQTHEREIIIAEIVTCIDSENGMCETFYRPIQRISYVNSIV